MGKKPDLDAEVAARVEALKEITEREAAHRLARLGGSDPDACAGPRRRPPAPEIN
jgi:hypothetical protein